MRRAVTPTIPPSLYRHFAIVTVVLTAGLAMFAEGENREAQAASVARPVQNRTAAPAMIRRASPASASPQAPDWWEAGASEVDSELSGGSQLDGESEFEAEAVSEHPPEYVKALNDRERGVLLSELQKQGMLEAQQRGTSPVAVSSHRSGSAH